MKKYITPNMDIRIFSDITETTDSSVEQTYVTGLKDLDKNAKAQVTLEQMSQITKFTF